MPKAKVRSTKSQTSGLLGKRSSNKTTLLSAVAVLVLVVAVAGYLAVNHASALSYSTYLCANNNRGNCIRTNGPGNYATIESTGWTGFAELSGGADIQGLPVYMFQNPNNYCLKAVGSVVTVVASACSSGVAADRWEEVVEAPPPNRYKNVANGDYMGTLNSTASGDRVQDLPIPSGFWYGWDLR